MQAVSVQTYIKDLKTDSEKEYARLVARCFINAKRAPNEHGSGLGADKALQIRLDLRQIIKNY